MTLYLVSGANFRCDLHYLPSLTHRSGSRGQVKPENNRKHETEITIFVYWLDRREAEKQQTATMKLVGSCRRHVFLLAGALGRCDLCQKEATKIEPPGVHNIVIRFKMVLIRLR